ncbi:Metal-dependent carboxypeptidase [Alphaproteobacteria bacterium]
MDINDNIKKLKTIKSIISALKFDLLTKMPITGALQRHSQVNWLYDKLYEILESYSISEIDAKLDQCVNPLEQRNIVLYKRAMVEYSIINKELKDKIENAKIKTEVLWRRAREECDFNIVSHSFRELVRLYREYANKLSEYYRISPYESLLRNYDFCCSEKVVDKLFTEVKEGILVIRNHVLDEQYEKHKIIYDRVRHIKIPHKKTLIKNIIKSIGFNLEKGCIAYSTHPFCIGSYDDVRIVLSKYDKHIISIVGALIHETGHALYSQNLPNIHINDLIGDFAGDVIHESQALLWEFCIGRSKVFSEYLAQILYKICGIKMEPYDYFTAVNYVQNGRSRLDSDELSYAIHIIMRYEIEKCLINGEVDVSDVPELWRVLTKKYNISCSRLGCLEDIHWYMGHVGYFPLYLLGAIYAAQFYNTLLSRINSDLLKCEFNGIVRKLSKIIYTKGNLYDSSVLIKKVTGIDICSTFYLQNLKDKYYDFGSI